MGSSHPCAEHLVTGPGAVPWRKVQPAAATWAISCAECWAAPATTDFARCQHWGSGAHCSPGGCTTLLPSSRVLLLMCEGTANYHATGTPFAGTAQGLCRRAHQGAQPWLGRCHTGRLSLPFPSADLNNSVWPRLGGTVVFSKGKSAAWTAC